MAAEVRRWILLRGERWIDSRGRVKEKEMEETMTRRRVREKSFERHFSKFRRRSITSGEVYTRRSYYVGHTRRTSRNHEEDVAVVLISEQVAPIIIEMRRSDIIIEMRSASSSAYHFARVPRCIILTWRTIPLENAQSIP